MSENILRVENITIQFGGLKAVEDVSFEVKRGEIYGIIGPNGAGKTTILNAISGIYTPVTGKIYFKDRDITGVEPHILVEWGIARTFQNSRLFWDLSVLDNVLLGMHTRKKMGLFKAIFNRGYVNQEFRDSIREAEELMAFFNPELVERKFHDAKSLPHADKRRLEICRALASNPDLILLDEPSAGMDPAETRVLMEELKKIQELRENITMIIIEHDMRLIGGVTDRVLVLDHGKKISEGTFAQVSSDPRVISAYLGGSLDA